MPVAGPLLIAKETGWFEKHGLNVVVKEYALGKIALEDMEEGEVDLACAAVTPIVYKILSGGSLQIIATVASSTGMVAVAARKDRGITQIADLEGKRVGISLGTSGEFYFETLRVLQRIPRKSVQVEDCTVERLSSGLLDGSLDAASVWEPLISQLDRAMPGKLQFFYGNGLYTFTWNLIALPQTIQKRRADIEKLLEGLFAAATLIETEPERARSLLQQRAGEDGRLLADHLDELRCKPSLTQDLLVQLEAEARWVIGRDSRSNAVPNFLRSIDASVLKKVRPEAVTLIQ